MANVSAHREIDCAWIEILRARSSSDAFRMHFARMSGDSFGCIDGSARVSPADLVRKRLNVLLIQFRAPFRISLPAALPDVRIIEALFFGTREGLFPNKNSLALVALTGPAEPEHDGSQGRVLRSPSRDAGISRRHEHEMAKVRAVDAQPSLAFFAEQVAFEELTAALVALRVTVGDQLKNDDFGFGELTHVWVTLTNCLSSAWRALL